MREIRYSGGLRMLESIVRTPAGRRVLRLEVHGAWTGEERGASGEVMAFAGAWPRQADYVLVNLANATAVSGDAAGTAARLRRILGSRGGDACFSAPAAPVAAALKAAGVETVATDAAAQVRFDEASAASPDVATVVLGPVEGWSRAVTTGACEFLESVVASPEGRRVLRVAPLGTCTGSDWNAGRPAREHLESLADIANFIVLDVTENPTWADAATASAWVLRTRMRAIAGDCVIAGASPALKRATIPFQWKTSPDLAQALARIDKGE